MYAFNPHWTIRWLQIQLDRMRYEMLNAVHDERFTVLGELLATATEEAEKVRGVVKVPREVVNPADPLRKSSTREERITARRDDTEIVQLRQRVEKLEEVVKKLSLMLGFDENAPLEEYR